MGCVSAKDQAKGPDIHSSPKNKSPPKATQTNKSKTLLNPTFTSIEDFL